MIQTQIDDGRGGVRTLTHNDPEYWEGAWRYEPFPKAVFRITKPGQSIADAEVAIVTNESELSRMGGWFESPATAKAHFERLEAEMAAAAAEVHFSTSRMSESAQREKRAADQATDEHVLDVPAPRRGPGRPKTVTSGE